MATRNEIERAIEELQQAKRRFVELERLQAESEVEVTHPITQETRTLPITQSDVDSKKTELENRLADADSVISGIDFTTVE